MSPVLDAFCQGNKEKVKKPPPSEVSSINKLSHADHFTKKSELPSLRHRRPLKKSETLSDRERESEYILEGPLKGHTSSDTKLNINKSCPRKFLETTHESGKNVLPNQICQTPVLRKSVVKKRLTSIDITQDIDEKYNDTGGPTDLDIQFQTMNIRSLTKSIFDGEKVGNGIVGSGSKSREPSRIFDNQRLLKIAPHTRRKDVICDTVDAWSNEREENVDLKIRKYKPLVFGGTYPIDVPFTSRLSRDDTETRTSVPKTFQVDEALDF